MGRFIDALPISDLEKRKLKQLGTETPFGLLSLIQAAPDEFDSLMGDSAGIVKEQIEKLVPASQRKLIGTNPTLPLGAQMERSPRIPPTGVDLELRDRLFAEWQRVQSNPATKDSGRAKELESQLNALLER